MTCQWCEQPSSFRFCSDLCYLAYVKDPRRAHVLCAICQYDPITKRIGNHETHRRCEDCTEAEENADWAQPSEYEQGSDDVDALSEVAGSCRLSEMFGGARKGDEDTTSRVISAAMNLTFKVMRRRRNIDGHLLRGWVEVEIKPSLREIAKEAECSHEQVRRILKRVHE